MNTNQCSVDPDGDQNLVRQAVNDPAALRRNGISEPLNVACGTVLTLDFFGNQPGPTSGFKAVLMDHRAFAQAALAANALLMSEQDRSQKKQDETVRQREAPKL